MSQAVTLKLKIEKELDVRSLDQDGGEGLPRTAAAAKEDAPLSPSSSSSGDEATSSSSSVKEHTHFAKDRGSMDKEEAKLLLRCVPSSRRD
jgi:hypothetical protein